MPAQRLHVIALISGGKDSFYSLLHCLRNGHRVVALANLFPGNPFPGGDVEAIDPGAPRQPIDGDQRGDLNSLMHQTVGHEVVPLYAAATGLPLYRRAIVGSAVRHERDYAYDDEGDDKGDDDETESMLPLLRAVMARHADADALCSGAILSTYQRTRVESVALRLGLEPLSFLWKYPELPGPADGAQLLADMDAAGLEARIVKVASAGLDEAHLWASVTTGAGAGRVKAALRRFGGGAGPAAALGEGGEFETLVLDGPARLFRRRIVVPDAGREIVREGGGAAWLRLRGARLEDKPGLDDDDDLAVPVRVPDLLDARFRSVLETVQSTSRDVPAGPEPKGHGTLSLVRGSAAVRQNKARELLQWSLLADASAAGNSIRQETARVVEKLRHALSRASRDPCHITNTVIILRDMSDFPEVNAEYGKLFTKPNPPSRVTICCGDFLPAGRNIMVHAAMPGAQGRGHGDRDGLHVQARSYWAPANIGPYSQAIAIPVTAWHEATGLRAVYAAGQIPLVPASMALPPPCDASLEQQTVLSLQHLWRIGCEMKVQYWTSAVAYFARRPSAHAMEHRARLAGRVWRLAHAAPEMDDEAEAESGPDLWDLRYNPEHMPLGANSAQSPGTALPDWNIFPPRQQKEPEACVPPLFAVEVESLPRQSAVEWHTHMGLGHVGEGSAETVYLPEVGDRDWRGWHMAVGAAGAVLVHTVLACRQADGHGSGALGQALAGAYASSLECLGAEAAALSASEGPYLAYVDAAGMEPPWEGVEGSEGLLSLALMPCRSIWSAQGERLGCVALYRSTIAIPQ